MIMTWPRVVAQWLDLPVDCRKPLFLYGALQSFEARLCYAGLRIDRGAVVPSHDYDLRKKFFEMPAARS
jgi:hypothetical protein